MVGWRNQQIYSCRFKIIGIRLLYFDQKNTQNPLIIKEETKNLIKVNYLQVCHVTYVSQWKFFKFSFDFYSFLTKDYLLNFSLDYLIIFTDAYFVLIFAYLLWDLHEFLVILILY